MKKANGSQLRKSFIHAACGLSTVYQSQINFRIQVFAAFAVLVCAFFVGVSIVELAVLFLSITLVLVFEIVNSCIESILDVFSSRVSGFIGAIKDLMAGGVLLVSLNAAAVGFFIFLPKLFHALRQLIAA